MNGRSVAPHRVTINRNDIRQFQDALGRQLTSLLKVEVRSEWRTMAGLAMYSPCLDVAVGPFATGELQLGEKFDALLARHHEFLHHLYELSNENVDQHGEGGARFDFHDLAHRNWNSRCFLAIEIENRVSRKHLMGGAINAAALGRIGIAVGWTPDKVRAFVKLRSYLLYLARVGKNTFNPINLLVLSRQQLRGATGRYLKILKSAETTVTE